jgi:glycerol-3-phosphate dehydrogenase
VGYRLGKGEKLDDIIKTLGSVAEGSSTRDCLWNRCAKGIVSGVTTAKALHEIVKELGVHAPVGLTIFAIV